MEHGRPATPRPGEPIRSETLRRMGDGIVTRLTVIGAKVKRIGTSVAIEIDRPRRGGSVATTLMRITSAEGSAPPFAYSAAEATWSGTAWSTKSGGIVLNASLLNLPETGGNYPGAAAIPVGQPVRAWKTDGQWWCEVLYLRDTYGG